jgi:hypothetical protein
MNKLLLLLFAFTISSYGQLNSNYERGYKDGYCKAKKEDKGQYTTCATSPRAPSPKVGKSSYSYGVIDGYQRYKNGGKNSAQNALINGAKAIGNSKKFVDYGKTVEKSFSNNYSSSTPSSASTSTIWMNRQIRSAKKIHKQIIKSIKKKWKYSSLSREERKEQKKIEIKLAEKKLAKQIQDIVQRAIQKRKSSY